MIIGDKRPKGSKSDDAMDKMDLFVAGKVGCFEAKVNRNDTECACNVVLTDVESLRGLAISELRVV